MLTPELLTRVKRELESGMPHADVATAMRIAGLTQAEVDEAFSIMGISSRPPPAPSPSVAVTNTVQPPPPISLAVPPVQPTPPVPPPRAMVTKMPDVPAQTLQSPPVATEAEFLAPSKSPTPVPPTRALPGTIKMPPPPPPTPPQQQAQVRMPESTFITPPKRSHRIGLIVAVFLSFIIAVGGVGTYAYLQKLGPFSDVGAQPYSNPIPISDISQIPAAAPTAATTVQTNVLASSSSATTSVSATMTSTTSTKVLECGGMQIPLPEKWYGLAKPDSQEQGRTLDADGCYKDSVGCLCQRKDTIVASQALLFSIASTSYSTAGRLADIVQALSHGRAENVKSVTFLGMPAMQFTTTEGTDSTGNIIFFKNQKLYSLMFGATDVTFKNLWPDILGAWQSARAK